MTETEARSFNVGDRVQTKFGLEKVVEIRYVGYGEWEILTEQSNGRLNTWGRVTSLQPPGTTFESDCVFSSHSMKPADPPRPLCPVEGERETIDWDAHRRFMRGLG